MLLKIQQSDVDYINLCNFASPEPLPARTVAPVRISDPT